MSRLFIGKRKTNHKKGIAAAHKAKKQAEAKERQASYDKMTLQDKFAKAIGTKEKNKILDLMNKLKVK